MNKYFKKVDNADNISEWKSKGLFNEVIKPPDNTLVPTPEFTAKKINLDIDVSCLKKVKITLNHEKTVNPYIFYELIKTIGSFSFALRNCLFGAVALISTNIQDMVWL